MAKKEKRFRVELGPVDGFVVFDTALGKNVDAPFRDREDAEARAAKREISSEPA